MKKKLTRKEVMETPITELKNKGTQDKGFGVLNVEQYKDILVYLEDMTKQFQDIMNWREQQRYFLKKIGIPVEHIESEECHKLFEITEVLTSKLKSDTERRRTLLDEAIMATRPICRGGNCG